jgi:hypothetical protein
MRVTHIFLDVVGTAPSFWRFEFDGTITLLQVMEGPCPEDTAPGGIGRADPMLLPWLVTFPISSIALICRDICLLLAIMTSRLTTSCLTPFSHGSKPEGMSFLIQPLFVVYLGLYLLHQGFVIGVFQTPKEDREIKGAEFVFHADGEHVGLVRRCHAMDEYNSSLFGEYVLNALVVETPRSS